MELPVVALRLTPAEALAEEAEDLVKGAIAGGCNLVVLDDGTEADGAGALYEAAVALSGTCRGRAMLLVANRPDIASAAGAQGVALTSGGLPIAVARRGLQLGAAEDAKTAPVVATIATTADDATTAAKEGTDLVIVSAESSSGDTDADALSKMIADARARMSVPLVAGCNGDAATAADVAAKCAADGAIVRASQLSGADARDAMGQLASAIAACTQDSVGFDDAPTEGSTDEESDGEQQAAASAGEEAVADAPSAEPFSATSPLMMGGVLGPEGDSLVADERALLADLVSYLNATTPQLEELPLLPDAIASLDELFLMVIVGEFNSGKSSLINALLGGNYLPTGNLPTTNEISLLKYNDDEAQDERTERDSDGQFVRYLPAPLLREITIVDTPGTNVVLERQQKLTEEYVPRADLVLFVLSADRPLSGSEVEFLRYIRRWGKKVIWALNKVDMLADMGEVESAVDFVTSNARDLLAIDDVRVVPVSARAALAAKGDGGVLQGAAKDNVNGGLSGFVELEEYMVNFLAGTPGTGAGEPIRLKLSTPLGVGSATLAAAARQLEGEAAAAADDISAADAVCSQIDDFVASMNKDSAVQRARVGKLVAQAVERCDALVDSTLSLGNLEALREYVLGGDATTLPIARAFKGEVIGSTIGAVEDTLAEHTAWLESNTGAQRTAYSEYITERWGLETHILEAASATRDAAGTSRDEGTDDAGGASEPSTSDEGDEDATSQSGIAEPSLATTLRSLNFDVDEAAAQLDGELREASMGVFSVAAGAAVAALAATAVLQGPLEDFLAVALGALAIYAGVLNIPLRRADVKRKVRARARALTEALDEALTAEASTRLAACAEDVKDAVTPGREAGEIEAARVADAQAARAALEDRLAAISARIARLGL